MEVCPGIGYDKFYEPAERAPLGLADLQVQLASIPFSQFGSIYYKEDVSAELQSRPLYRDGHPADDFSERFRIGPSVDRRFYRSDRARMDVDRGPCAFMREDILQSGISANLCFLSMTGPDVLSYTRAIANCEIQWIQQYASSPDAKHQLGARHTPEEHIKRLEQWLAVAPAILPAEEELCAPALMHPDLHPTLGTYLLAKTRITQRLWE